MDYYWPPSLLVGVPPCNHQEKNLQEKKMGAPRGRGLSKKSAQHCRTTAATAAAAARPPRHHHEFCSVAWPPACGASAHSTYVVSSGEEEACQVGGRRSSPRPPATLAYWLASMALSCCLLPGGQKIKASSSSHLRQRLQTGTRSHLPPCGLLSQQGGWWGGGQCPGPTSKVDGGKGVRARDVANEGSHRTKQILSRHKHSTPTPLWGHHLLGGPIWQSGPLFPSLLLLVGVFTGGAPVPVCRRPALSRVLPGLSPPHPLGLSAPNRHLLAAPLAVTCIARGRLDDLLGLLRCSLHGRPTPGHGRHLRIGQLAATFLCLRGGRRHSIRCGLWCCRCCWSRCCRRGRASSCRVHGNSIFGRRRRRGGALGPGRCCLHFLGSTLTRWGGSAGGHG